MMPITFDSDEEVFAALSWIIMCADGKGSPEERDFLYNKLHEMDIFRDYDPIQFSQRMGAMNTKIFDCLQNDGISFTPEGIKDFVQSAKNVISPNLYSDLFNLAVKIACLDGLNEKERKVIDQLQTGFGIDAKTAEETFKLYQ